MKILVTGGAGYIGSILVPKLLEEAHEVVVIDNFMYNQTSLLDCCYNKNLTIIRGNVNDYELMGSLVKDKDIIIPLACIVGAPACDRNPDVARFTNHSAIMTMMQSMKKGFWKHKNPKIIFPTTNSGYGLGQKNVFCTEETPLNPISLYGRMKVATEAKLLEFDNVITLRLATVFGISSRMRLDLLVNDFVYRAVNDGVITIFEPHYKRNYIHVRDIANAFIHCIANFDIMKNEPYNVGLSDCNISKQELCIEIQKQIPNFQYYIGEGKDPDQRNYIVSNEKIEATGFKPDHSLQQGIKELIKGYTIIRRNDFTN